MKSFTNRRRVTALGLVVALTVILFLSSLFVITHLKHECTGEDCPVCARINVCMTALHMIAEAVGLGSVIICAYVFIKKIVIHYLVGLFLLPASLVRLKIRMDN